MKNSNIEWCDHTFNPWIGCTKVSPGCVNCYAEARDIRYAKGAHWGKGAPRQRTSPANWKQPLRWNAAASPLPRGEGQGEGQTGTSRPRVFCASLADWLDDEVPIAWLADLLKLIHDTPNLDWLLLTKRPENWRKRLAMVHATTNAGSDLSVLLFRWLHTIAPTEPSNVWLGVTVENQHYTDRIVHLFRIPARIRFLSVEPMLGPVDFMPWMYCRPKGQPAPQLHWIICGGESGPKKRQFDPAWARSLRDQCKAAGVPFFMKQIDKVQPIPDDLMIRQFPTLSASASLR